MTELALHPSDVFLPTSRRRLGGPRGRELAQRLVGLSLLGDLAVTFAALAAAFALRFRTALGTALGVSQAPVAWHEFFGHFVFQAFTLLLVFYHLDLYSTEQTSRFRKTGATLLTGCVLWLVVSFSLTGLLGFQTLVSRTYLGFASVALAGGLLGWRAAFDGFLRSRDVAGRLRRRILCVGWTEGATRLAEQIAADSRHPYVILGAVPGADGGFASSLPRGVRTLGDFPEVREILGEWAVDMVVVCDPDPSRDALVGLANLCEKELVDFKVIPSCFQILLSGLHLETVSGVPVLGISRLPLDRPFAAVAKRVVDIVGSLTGLLLSAPLLAVFGLLVWLESPGPIFYRQRRSGRNGRDFFIVKIRSMRLDAEAAGQRPGWTQREDPRRLRVGAFMRRWNIDEVPQFLNVLRGDMSLVGPRPERPEFIADFKEEIPHYNARHGIQPGITGWAQVNGFRGDTDLTERVRCDLFYMENWSLLLDFQIMFMTFWKRQNAG